MNGFMIMLIKICYFSMKYDGKFVIQLIKISVFDNDLSLQLKKLLPSKS